MIIWGIRKPVGLFIWLFGLTFAADIASQHASNPELFFWVAPVRRIGAVLIVGWALLRIIRRVEAIVISGQAGKKLKMDETTSQALAHLLRITVFITIALIILQILDIPITGLLAFGGAGAVAIGLAAKDLLSNFFGAIIVYMDRPFSVGDWISSPDKKIEGTVESIGWRVTRIRSFERRPIYVPNSVFTTISVVNNSRMSNRRIKTVVGVRYCDAAKLKAITGDIKSMLAGHQEIDATKPLYVNLINYGPSSLDIEIYTFTKTTEWVPFQQIQQDILMGILDIILGHGAEVAFPTRTLDIPEGLLSQPKES
jgi:MscS family membrane protein